MRVMPGCEVVEHMYDAVAWFRHYGSIGGFWTMSGIARFLDYEWHCQVSGL